MPCPKCGRETISGAGFCKYCGERLAVECHSCGRQNPPDGLYCHGCGVRLADDGARSGERPQTADPPAGDPASVACPRCYTRNEPTAPHCSECGLPLDGSVDPATPGLAPPSATYRPSWRRVAIMMIASLGWYQFYWFYRTWRDYRDVTGDKVYPVWHALTLLVPIYGLFRTHAHFRVYKDLMSYRGVPGTISPGWNVAPLVALMALSGAYGALEEVSVAAAVLLTWFAGFIVVYAGLIFVLAHVQSNLNRLWHQHNGDPQATPFALGEWVFAGIGAFMWLLVLLGLVFS